MSRSLTDREWDDAAETALDHLVRTCGTERPPAVTAEQAIRYALSRAEHEHRDIIDPWESVNHRLYIEGVRVTLRDARSGDA